MAQHKPIRSKWQDWLAAYKKGNVLVALGSGILRVPDRLRGWDKAKLDAYLDLGKKEHCDIPRYVFSDETKTIIRSKQTIETIELLKEFGRYHLPHPVCAAEYDDDESGIRIFAICYEKADCDMYISSQDAKYPFVVCMFALYDFSGPEIRKSLKNDQRLITDQFAVLYPVIANMENVSADYLFDDHKQSTAEELAAGGVCYLSMPAPWLPVYTNEFGVDRPIDSERIVHDYTVSAGFSIRALTTLLQTKGIARDTLTSADLHKLNKKRTGSQTAQIPPHTYITLGHACKRDGVAIPNPTGRKLRFHMRAGHVKNQPCGPNNSERKRIFIEPYLVNEIANEALIVPNRIVKA